MTLKIRYLSYLPLIPLILLALIVIRIDPLNIRGINLSLTMKNSIHIAIFTIFYSVIIGTYLGTVMTRYNFLFKKFINILIYLPMVIPTYVLAIVYSDIFSIKSIYLLELIISLSLYPYVYSATCLILSKKSDKIDQLEKFIQLDLLTKLKIRWLDNKLLILGTLFIIFCDAFNEFGATYYYDVRTFTVEIYRLWFNYYDIDSAFVYSFALFIFFSILTTLYQHATFLNRTQTVPNDRGIKETKIKIGSLLFFYFIVGILSLVSLGIPLGMGIYWSFLSEVHFDYQAIFNTVMLVMEVCLYSVIMGIVLIYSVNRSNTQVVQFGLTLNYLLPSIVLGFTILIFKVEYGLTFNITGPSVIALIVTLRYLYLIYLPNYNQYLSLDIRLGQMIRYYNLDLFSKIKIHFSNYRYSMLVGILLVSIEVLKELPLTMLFSSGNYYTLSTKIFSYIDNEVVEVTGIYIVILILLSSFIFLVINMLRSKHE